MGASDLNAAGYRSATVIKDFEFVQYCGGMGGGNFALLMNTQRAIFKIKNNPFTVRNEKLILLNEQFTVNVNAGANGMGGYNEGARLPLYWAATHDPAAITDAQIIARNNVIPSTTAPPYYVTMEADDLPQPINPGWAGFTYVIIHWTDPTAVSQWAQVLNEDGVQTAPLVVMDYQQDVKI